MDEFRLETNLNDVTCPICLDFPHNGVLLQCSSYDNGCRAFVCDTDHLHSNCLARFKQAYGTTGTLSGSDSPLTSDAASSDAMQMKNVDTIGMALCPLCRGEVSGWVVVDEVRRQLDGMKRSCEEENCAFKGTYMELRKHALLEHPHSCPSKIDPARQLDWENFQQSSEIIDVLSTIHSEIPRGVVLGDYVIEYGDHHSDDELEDFRGDERSWWTSCILYHVFDNFRTSRNRRRSRINNSRRGNRRLSYDTSNSDEGSVASIEYPDFRAEETDDEFATSRNLGVGADHRSRRRRSRFFDS